MTSAVENLDPTDPLSARLRNAASAAVADVDAVGVDGPDRQVMLGVLLAARLGLLAGNVPSAGDKSHADEMSAGGAPSAGASLTALPAPAEGDLVGRIAAALKIDRDVADLIYDVKDGELGYVLSARRLATDKSNATRQLAQVVAAGRQAAGLEEWTPASVVREVVNDYGKLDGANFASYINKLDKDNACLLRDKGVNRQIKVTRSGIESIADVLTALVRTDGKP